MVGGNKPDLCAFHSSLQDKVGKTIADELVEGAAPVVASKQLPDDLVGLLRGEELQG